MLNKRRSFGTRKVSPPQPTCMTEDQKATYLANLRNNRPARPGGARPLPPKNTPRDTGNSVGLPLRSESVLSFRRGEEEGNADSKPTIVNSSSMPALKGRPLVQAPKTTSPPAGETNRESGEIKYRESSSRELEKQEAHLLREALERIDHVDDETRIYTAAQKEASDLVWKHINPKLAEHEKTAAYRNPDLERKRRQAMALAKEQAAASRPSDSRDEPISDASPSSGQGNEPEGLKLSKRGSRDDIGGQPTINLHGNRRRSSSNRNTSGSSVKGVFRNPDDQIYEEPEEVETLIIKKENAQEMPLRTRPRNSLPRGSRPLPTKPFTMPSPEKPRFNHFDIHKNPVSQSRNAGYTANATESREATPEVEVPSGPVVEIRSEDIRAATSMRRKDRSPNLPTPTAVSDKPGRPIVSFDPSWRPGAGSGSPRSSVDVERPSSRTMPPLPTSSRSAPIVPTINLPDEDVPQIDVTEAQSSIPSISVAVAPPVPKINLPDTSTASVQAVPSINLPDDQPAAQALPQITVESEDKPRARPLPLHTQSSPSKLPASGQSRPIRTPWLSRGAAGTMVSCDACQLPISGRIVTAGGSRPGGPKVRFHPECFRCFHCSTKLECVSFYPEPESARGERLQQEDQSDSLEMRFYCHLDYHDLFSPRCASCKTPIEGAVILAAGKSWHEGHFFCAECGDPFNSTSPFVEDKGYAYCVSCHTKRTSTRCRGCKKQILDDVCVEALGGKWHEPCFRCDSCDGDFGDDGRFFVREVEIELTEKEKRKGILTSKFEDRAVCQFCEELRLKNQESFL